MSGAVQDDFDLSVQMVTSVTTLACARPVGARMGAGQRRKLLVVPVRCASNPGGLLLKLSTVPVDDGDQTNPRWKNRMQDLELSLIHI